jgi:membrane-associated phospholipid phosphatase
VQRWTGCVSLWQFNEVFRSPEMPVTCLLGLLLAAPASAPRVTHNPSWTDAAILGGSLVTYFTLHQGKEPWFDLAWSGTTKDQTYNEDTVPVATFYMWGAGLSLVSGLEGGWLEATAATQTLALTAASTELLKYSLGRPRPDYDDRMRLFAQTGDEKLRRDARLSLPSGHSSAAFALALHSGLWVHRAACRRGWGSPAIAAGYALPLVIATAIGWTRIDDHRHNPSDVATGALLGLGVSYGVNQLQFGKPTGCNGP